MYGVLRDLNGRLHRICLRKVTTFFESPGAALKTESEMFEKLGKARETAMISESSVALGGFAVI